MIVVVGGHSRNIGKTSVMCSIIRQTAEFRWTAVKITQFGHSACSSDGEPCECEPRDAAHPFALDETRKPDATDSGRYLAAGAVQSFWLRTRQQELAEALPKLREIVAGSENAILESNSVIDLIRPDVYVFVADPAIADFKTSAQRNQTLADAVVQTGDGALSRLLEGKPRFQGMDAAGLGDWIRQRAAVNRTTTVTR